LRYALFASSPAILKLFDAMKTTKAEHEKTSGRKYVKEKISNLENVRMSEEPFFGDKNSASGGKVAALKSQ
jgi:hypothetical protein